ncbi:MAG TPA: hypothetical protein VKP02_04610 [Gemmatimonadaceae bacterium]|nr:hypothetical protein [Gemmatimonadaceae bacterium]
MIEAERISSRIDHPGVEDRTMRQQHPALVVVAVSCALLAGGARQLSAQLPKDACAQVTQAQVASALGMPVHEGQSLNSLGTACSWAATSPNKARLTVQFMVADSYDRLKSERMPHVEKSPVAGIGDDAFSQTIPFSTTVPKMTTLFVRKGRTMVVVRTYDVPSSAKQLSAEKAVAHAVVARL